MQNPVDSPRFSAAAEPVFDVYANDSFQGPDQENIVNPRTSKVQSVESSPKRSKFEPSNSPNNRSNQSSPINFNFLAEAKRQHRATRRDSSPSENSNSLIVAKFESDPVDTSNINSKIAQILVESKSVSPDGRHDRFDLSFSMKTDCSIEVNDLSDNMKQSSQHKKHKKTKEQQNAAFDDSLNNDIFYDPNISTIAHVKTMDLSKNEKEHDNRTPNNMKEMKKVITTLEYKPERGRYEQMVQGHQASSLFEGVTDDKIEPNESRLSKLSEEEAAFLFETRKNTLMRGLQKLNKHRKVNNLPKSNNHSPKSRGKDYDRSPYSGDSSPGRQSVKGFVVENVEARRSRSSQHAKQQSLNHQKAYKSVRVDTYEQLGISDSPPGPMGKKGRSLSHQDVKPLELETLESLDSSRVSPGKNKIDEMYQMAKEDVKKRIASIEKRLVETEGLQSGRRSADSKPVKRTSPRTQQITLTVVHNNKEKSVERTERSSSKQKTKFATEPSPVNKNDKNKMERGRAFQEDAYQLVGKKVLTINLTTADYEAMKKQNKTSKSPTTLFGEQKKRKTEEKIPLLRKELSPSPQERQERPLSGRNAYDVKQTTQTQSYDGIKADTKKFLIEDSRYKQYDSKVVQRAPLGPPKFSDLEAMATQGNSYSQMHVEKRNKLLMNERGLNNVGGMRRSEPVRAKESFGGPVKANMVFNLADAGTPSSKNKKNLQVRFSDQEKKEAQDVKYFMLRPESEKVITKKVNTSTSAAAAKSNDRMSLDIVKKASQESIPTKQAKIARASNSESNQVPNQQQSSKLRTLINEMESLMLKPARSSSSKQIKPYKNDQVDQRLKTCEPVYTVSEGSKGKQTEQSPSPRGTVQLSLRNEKQRVPSVSRTQPKTWNKALGANTDRISSPKTIFMNKDSAITQKREIAARNQAPVTQKKEKLIYATSAENMEELLSRNYRFLEIRNNQYVFTTN